MPLRNHIITGPDIDKLAQGIHGPELAALSAALKQAQTTNKALRKDLRAARKSERAATNKAESLLRDLATSRTARKKYARENALLKSQMRNAGITPLLPTEETHE